MSNENFYVQVAELINKDLGSYDEETALVPQNMINQNLLKEKLAGVVAHLLETNFEKLCQAMYRLDVSEQKFDHVLSGSSKEDIPSEIADLIIEREIQKVKTRILYKDKKL